MWIYRRLIGRSYIPLVRFPNSLAFGSELGLHCPYRRGIFLSTLPARPIWTAHGQGGAYWIAPHLRKPHAQARLFFHSLVLPFALHFYPPPECNFCWRQVLQLDFSFSSFQISSARMQLLCLLKINASVFVKLFISYFFCAGVVQLGLVQMGVDHFRELKKWSSSPWLHKIVRQFTIWSSIIFCV